MQPAPRPRRVLQYSRSASESPEMFLGFSGGYLLWRTEQETSILQISIVASQWCRIRWYQLRNSQYRAATALGSVSFTEVNKHYTGHRFPSGFGYDWGATERRKAETGVGAGSHDCTKGGVWSPP